MPGLPLMAEPASQQAFDGEIRTVDERFELGLRGQDLFGSRSDLSCHLGRDQGDAVHIPAGVSHTLAVSERIEAVQAFVPGGPEQRDKD